jgi:hypothetical protein
MSNLVPTWTPDLVVRELRSEIVKSHITNKKLKATLKDQYEWWRVVRSWANSNQLENEAVRSACDQAMIKIEEVLK